MKKNILLRNGYLSAVYLFFYLPLIVLIVLSFNNAHLSFNWHGFTWQWYQALWQDTQLHLALWHSLSVSLLAASAATFIGSVGAIALYRYRVKGRQLIYGLVFILIILPDLVMGISLLLLFTIFKLPLGFVSLLLAHITFCLPFVVVLVYSRLSGFNEHLLEAAKDLGANDYITFHRIIVPLLKPAILAAWFLSFSLSIDDLVISFFVSGPTYQILPIYIYSQLRVGPTPEINALCTLIILVTFLLVVVAQYFLRKRA
ncbi:MAG: spermidine/putrescine ABC transporter permease PotC [Legionellaceae bacterium]|nr:spermidine/putrescine ABC transporter permease PotC [Legionellaceae bacterium]